MVPSSTTDILLESRRRAYLSALGIPLYHPRRLLPGALPSSQFAAVKRASAPPTLIPADSGKTASVHAALAQLQAVAVPTNTKVATKSGAASVPPKPELKPERGVVAETEEQQAEAPAFAFAFVPVNEQLAVINELPWAGSAMLAPGSRQLLAGILKALSLPCEERHLSSLNFVWPLPEMPLAEQGAGPARDLLKGFLAQRFRIRPVRYLLVLAEQGAPYLFPDNFDLSQTESVFRHPDFDVKVLVTRSLGAMEAAPALKRDVWTALQPLLAALKRQNA